VRDWCGASGWLNGVCAGGVSEDSFLLALDSEKRAAIVWRIHSCGLLLWMTSGAISLSGRLGWTGTLGVLDMASRLVCSIERVFGRLQRSIFRYRLRLEVLLEEEKIEKRGNH